MPAEMRGLTQFIADLRQCRVRELEEKRINKEMAHIRQKFKDGSLDGYQRKKYLAKIVFTYILGYPVDVGHMEAVNLVASTKYSEKQIGYLALTLLMHENSDLVRLVVNSIRKDLEDLNEVNNCLALHAIANIGGKEMAESLANDVHRLLIAPTSPPFVKKKAALTLLRIYRKHPEVVAVQEWALRIVSIMDDEDLGVTLSVSSLVLTLAQDHLDAYSVCVQKAISRLGKIVLDHEYPSEYLYYRVPIPWLQIKLLRLLQYYPPVDDPTLRQLLHEVLKAILKASAEPPPRNIQHNNAQNAVLFEAINLIIHLDTSPKLVNSAAHLLGQFITARETNVRYLGLDTMAHLASNTEHVSALKKHQDTVLLSLRDRDISIRRRGLDLLYSMCDSSNAKVIVGELLRYMPIADYTLREEMCLKVAILTEKFATEYQWYINTILQLMSVAGDHVGEEVWHRIIQIVTNTEELQEYAVRKVYEHLRTPQCHENIIKVGAYILGEYGDLVANDPGMSPIEQFDVLHSKSNLCSPSTRALLLTTYFKWLNLFPEIREPILITFRRYRYILDAELQQRACEYLAVAERADGEELLQVICEEMPPFPERESALLSRLLKKHDETSDKRVWGLGTSKSALADSTTSNPENKQADTSLSNSVSATAANGSTADGTATTTTNNNNNNNNSFTASDDIMANLAGLDLSSSAATPLAQSTSDYNISSQATSTPAAAASAPLIQDTSPQQQTSTTTAAATTTTTNTNTNTNGTESSNSNSNVLATPPKDIPKKMTVMTMGQEEETHGADKWLRRLLGSNEGIFFEDGQLQIGLKAEYHGHQGRIVLYFGNKIPATFTSFTMTVENSQREKLSITTPRVVGSTLTGMSQMQQLLEIECKNVFTETPARLKVSYLAGSHQTVNLRLPIVLSKFIEPVQLAQADFFDRWKQIGAGDLESQKIFGIKLNSKNQVDTPKQKRVVEGCRLSILDSIDPNPLNIVGAGVLHTSNGGKAGCLIRLEPNADAKLCRLTVRATRMEVAKEIADLISRPLSVST